MCRRIVEVGPTVHIDNSDIDIFADDATLHKSSNEIHNINIDLQVDGNNVVQWCKQNGPERK